MKFTVFHVDGERGLRGGERQLLYLAAALRARGHDNVVCCRHGDALDGEARGQGFETLGLPFHFEFDPRSAWLLARAARRPHPIIHAHTAHALGIAAISQLFGGPAIVAHRRVDFPLRGSLSRLKYRRAGRLVAVSQAIARVLETGGIPGSLVTVIHDAMPVSAEEWSWVGIDPPPFAVADPERRHQARRALAESFGLDLAKAWVGNLAALEPRKDHDTLIRAAGRVLDQRPDTLFLIAGRGPEQERLEAAIKHRGLEGKVVLLGHQDDPALVLAALDVFVLSSQGEGMGSVLLEAAATGVAIAATNVGGIPEVIEHEFTGLLAPAHDESALAACILRLLDDPGLARRLAAAGLAALSRFGLGAAAERFEKIYEGLSRASR